MLETAAVLVIPFMIVWARRWKPLRAVDALVWAYALGTLLGQFTVVPRETATAVATVAVGFCIPLMLLGLDLPRAISRFKKSFLVMAFFASFVVIVAVGLIPILESHEFGPSVAGMLTGTLVGSAPNMASVGLAVQVPQEQFLLVQSTDLIVCGIFFVFLLAVGLPYLLPRVPLSDEMGSRQLDKETRAPTKETKGAYARSFLVAIAVVACTGVTSQLLPTEYRDMGAMVCLSLFSLLASLVPKRHVADTLPVGEFVFLFFCASMGSQVKLGLISELPLTYLAYATLVMLGAIFLHFWLCRAFRVDRNIFMLTSVAGIFSPAMIAPIARRLGDQDLIAVGVAVSLLGLLLGTSAGLLTYFLSQQLWY